MRSFLPALIGVRGDEADDRAVCLERGLTPALPAFVSLRQTQAPAVLDHIICLEVPSPIWSARGALLLRVRASAPGRPHLPMLASSSPPYFSASILRNDQLAVHLKDAKAALSRRPACPPPTMWVARVEQAAGLLPFGWLCGPCIRRCADRPARDVCAPGLSSLRPESRVCGHAFGVPVSGLMPGAHVALAAEPNAAVNVVARNALAAPGAQLAARTLVTALALCFVACAAPATVGLAARGGHQPLSTGLYTTLQTAIGIPLGHSRR